jgi:hypothetical protein
MSPLTLRVLQHITICNEDSVKKKADARSSMSNKKLQNTEQKIRTLRKWKMYDFNPSRADNNLFKTAGAMFINEIWNVHMSESDSNRDIHNSP